MPPSVSDLSRNGPVTSIEVDQPMDQVFDVLVDPRTYPDWLVGADAIRSVDDAWPEPGSAFHHVVGAGPLKLRDKSSVVAVERPRRLELDVFARPLLRAHVVFSLSEQPGGGTQVEMRERPREGVIGVLWRCVGRVGVAVGLQGRNALTLQRLRNYLAERTS